MYVFKITPSPLYAFKGLPAPMLRTYFMDGPLSCSTKALKNSQIVFHTQLHLNNLNMPRVDGFDEPFSQYSAKTVGLEYIF